MVSKPKRNFLRIIINYKRRLHKSLTSEESLKIFSIVEALGKEKIVELIFRKQSEKFKKFAIAILKQILELIFSKQTAE